MKKFSIAILVAMFAVSCGEAPKEKAPEVVEDNVVEASEKKGEYLSLENFESKDEFYKYIVRNSYKNATRSGDIWPIYDQGIYLYKCDLDLKNIPGMVFDTLGMGSSEDKELKELTIENIGGFLYWIYSIPIEPGTESCFANTIVSESDSVSFLQDLPCAVPDRTQIRDTVTLIAIIPSSMLIRNPENGSIYFEYAITMVDTRNGAGVEVKKTYTKSGGK